jgi:hypothetical protein
MNRNAERVVELARLIDNARTNLPLWEKELESLLPGPGGRRRKAPAESANVPAQESNGRSTVTAALLRVLPKMPEEFTSRDLIDAAGIAPERENSAFAAISRLAADGKRFKKGTKPKTFQRV